MNDAEATLGQEPPLISTRPPGEHSRSFLLRHAHATAPMGPKKNPGDRPSGIVYASALGSNVVDVDGNRYVDLAAGFGAELLGHRHPAILRALSLESGRLLHALGDLYPSDAKVGLVERIVRLYRNGRNQVIRIPRDMELPGTEALLHKAGDRLIVEPMPRPSLLEVLSTWGPLEEESPESITSSRSRT